MIAVLIGIVVLLYMAGDAGRTSFPAAKPKQGWRDRCNGDCENCPPHYGYNHPRGCEFGGNRCSGSMD